MNTYGACPSCKGLGITKHISLDLIMPDKSLSVLDGGINQSLIQPDPVSIYLLSRLFTIPS